MSIEAYLIANLIADISILGATARALGIFRWRRVLLSGIICAASAAIAAASPHPFAGGAQFLVLAGTSLLVARGFGAWVWLKTAALAAGGMVLAGGIAYLTRPSLTGPIGAVYAPVGAALLALMVSARHPLRGDWQVELTLESDLGSARFPALIDTGNRLREPLSGQPVLIAEARLLEGFLPSTGWRELRFGAVGGGGSMACFKPAELWIGRGRRRIRAPEVWIALSPGPLPGSARALAPSEFASFV